MYSFINPLTSPGEGVTVFTSPYLSAGAPALGEAKVLILISKNKQKNKKTQNFFDNLYPFFVRKN